MPADGRTDRRIAIDRPHAGEPQDSRQIVFRDDWGQVVQTFDPHALDMPDDLTSAFVEALCVHDAGSSVTTRRGRWRVLQRFGRFLRTEGICCARDVNAGTIRRYIDTLATPASGHQLSRATMAQRIATLKPLLDHVERAHPDLFGSILAIPYSPFPSVGWSPEAKARLTATEMKMILVAAYDEIDMAWERFRRGQEIIAAPLPPEGTGPGQALARWVWKLHRIGGGIAPSGEAIRAAGINPNSLEHYGRQEAIAQHYHLTSHTMAPFYVALAIQLAANPQPLREIRRDCLVPHPLDDNRVMVEWLKRRTGRNAKMQRRSFDPRRPRSAPRLIEMLLEMTEPLIAHAPPDERECLFLIRYCSAAYWRRHNYPAGLIAPDSISGFINRFIRRANRRIERWNCSHPERPKPLVPKFTASQLRGSVATEHYVASGGDLRAAGAILNHASLVTTDRYVEGSAARKLEQETIARLQRLMVAWVSGPDREQPTRHGPVTALFGHRCLAPVEKSRDGDPSLCPRLRGCLACPGLIVPLDVERFARVLQARRHLLAARDQIDPVRWALFYGPSLHVLEHDLLPAFPAGMREQAEQQAALLPNLPDLE